MADNNMEELEELRSVVRDFFASRTKQFDAVEPGKNVARAIDQASWSSLANELGLTSILVPEEYGGAGGAFAEAAVVLEESGRLLVGDPLLASAVLAVTAIIESGDEAAMDGILPGLADGTLTGTLAFGRTTVQAQAGEGRAWTVDGTVDSVLNGADVDIILVIAACGTDRGLFAVERGADCATVERKAVLDQTRSLASVSLTGVPARLVGEIGAPFLNRVEHIAEIALAAEQIGGASRALDMAVDYAKTREAFGRPIGSFQAVKHTLAEVFFAVEAARGSLDLAVSAIRSGEDLGFAAATARVAATEAFVRAAAENIQVHGAIGFTWEYPAHHYLKRAYASKELLTSRRDLLARVATQLEERAAQSF
jgi:acyl-CoA dehydrogenase